MLQIALLRTEIVSLLFTLALLAGSETVQVTLITSITTVLIALIALWTLILTMRNQQAIATANVKVGKVDLRITETREETKTDIKQLHEAVDGKMELLLKSTGDTARLEGAAEGKDELAAATTAQAKAEGILEGQATERAQVRGQ